MHLLGCPWVVGRRAADPAQTSTEDLQAFSPANPRLTAHAKTLGSAGYLSLRRPVFLCSEQTQPCPVASRGKREVAGGAGEDALAGRLVLKPGHERDGRCGGRPVLKFGGEQQDKLAGGTRLVG